MPHKPNLSLQISETEPQIDPDHKKRSYHSTNSNQSCSLNSLECSSCSSWWKFILLLLLLLGLSYYWKVI